MKLNRSAKNRSIQTYCRKCVTGRYDYCLGE